ncbi:MAG: glutamine amidotransferase [Candidatus Hadarchaeaceae archaeon]
MGVMLRGKGKVGEYLYRMMLALQHRGTDSAGVAIYTEGTSSKEEHVLMVQIKDVPGAIGEVGNAIGSAGGDIRNIEFRHSPSGGMGLNRYLIRVPNRATLERVVGNINATKVGEVFSYGRSIQVIKDLGVVSNLQIGYNILGMAGTHGIGHVRFSTESRVDCRHAHPFHTNVYPDIAVVHNGQITNYHKIRRMLERKGHAFTSENDTECIVHFIVDLLQRGCSFKGALERSVEELDGPFSYVISTPTAIGVARDKLGLRPVMLSQDRFGYYIASEECALISIDKDLKPTYLEPGGVHVYEREGH